MITSNIQTKITKKNTQTILTQQEHSDQIFTLGAYSGDGVFDKITGVPSICVISGARYGLVNGVVSQFAANQPPIEDAGLRGCPAFTQLAKMSETLTDANWIKGNMLTPVLAGTLQGMNIWNCAESTAVNDYHTFYQTPWTSAIPDNSIVGLCCILKYSGRKIGFIVRTKANAYSMARFNLQTGVFETTNIFKAYAEHLGNGYYKTFVSCDVGIGALAPLLYLQPLTEANVSQYTSDGVSGVLIGQPTYINFGVGGIPFIPPYIPNNTNGSISVVPETATATTGTSFGLDDAKLMRFKTALRGPNAQGHVEFKLKLNFNRVWKTTNTPILSVNNDPTGDFLYYSVSGNAWSTYDTSGNRAQVSMPSFDVGQIVTFAADFGAHSTGQKQRLTVNGVKSSLVAFSGSWGSNDLRFFYDAGVHAGWIIKDSLRIMDRPQW